MAGASLCKALGLSNSPKRSSSFKYSKHISRLSLYRLSNYNIKLYICFSYYPVRSLGTGDHAQFICSSPTLSTYQVPASHPVCLLNGTVCSLRLLPQGALQPHVDLGPWHRARRREVSDHGGNVCGELVWNLPRVRLASVPLSSSTRPSAFL